MILSEIDQSRFQKARDYVLCGQKDHKSIGTLSEKTLHAVLKEYYEPDHSRQEVKIESYVADIFTGKEIIEIQTAQFHRMREKLKIFLPLYPVTIVYPIPRNKWLFWVDVDSGEISNPRKSPRRGTIYDIFRELYRIKAFLKEPNLNIRIDMMDMEEYKLLNGWGKHKKNNASKYDRIPIELVQEIDIRKKEDYLVFMPDGLKEKFTSGDFAKAAHIPDKKAILALNILFYIGIVERVGKKGNSYIYVQVQHS